jgi:hypothetical protein
MRHNLDAVIWMGAAFCVALASDMVVLAVLGTGEQGISAAIALAARVAFLFFWPAYAGGALAVLFGPSFEGVARRGRELGLAFASALLVHFAFVVWLFRIAERQPIPDVSIVYFGIGALWTYLLVLFSVKSLAKILSSSFWRIFRIVGMEYIAFLFCLDFVVNPLVNGVRHPLGYVPFSLLIIAGPVLRIAAMVRRRREHVSPKSIGKAQVGLP